MHRGFCTLVLVDRGAKLGGFTVFHPIIGSEPATSAVVTTNPTDYEDVELQPPTITTAREDHKYEDVELKLFTTQKKEIEVDFNAAYDTV